MIATESINGSSQRWHAPKKYITPETSGLEIDIQKATDSLVIELSWEGGAPFVEHFGSEGTAAQVVR